MSVGSHSTPVSLSVYYPSVLRDPGMKDQKDDDDDEGGGEKSRPSEAMVPGLTSYKVADRDPRSSRVVVVPGPTSVVTAVPVRPVSTVPSKLEMK